MESWKHPSPAMIAGIVIVVVIILVVIGGIILLMMNHNKTTEVVVNTPTPVVPTATAAVPVTANTGAAMVGGSRIIHTPSSVGASRVSAPSRKMTPGYKQILGRKA